MSRDVEELLDQLEDTEKELRIYKYVASIAVAMFALVALAPQLRWVLERILLGH